MSSLTVVTTYPTVIYGLLGPLCGLFGLARYFWAFARAPWAWLPLPGDRIVGRVPCCLLARYPLPGLRIPSTPFGSLPQLASTRRQLPMPVASLRPCCCHFQSSPSLALLCSGSPSPLATLVTLGGDPPPARRRPSSDDRLSRSPYAKFPTLFWFLAVLLPPFFLSPLSSW